ncbi:MAG: glutamyl-tRNA reductase [Bacteroidetes bacterium]|nr:glutamyl-tRNA reductase [Bacteroidota bacterium]
MIGTNFTKADIQTRSHFALNGDSTAEVYARALNLGLKDFFVLSTCNRTEFYACAPMSLLKELVCDQLSISEKQIGEYFYFEFSRDAISHFFKVVCGLNSQIIGDYEIVGQVKKAIQVSRQYGLTGTLTDRITSFAFHASKEVKVKTNLSHGKYSVSYAASELILANEPDQNGKILIIGTGEMGQAVARNLREYFPTRAIAVTNRTLTHAQSLAAEIGAEVIPFESFPQQLQSFNTVLTTAQANGYLIRHDNVPDGKRLFLDLSVPQVIDPSIKRISGVRLFSLDEISSFHNTLIAQRQTEIPKAESILEEYIQRLMEWQTIYLHRDVLLSYKEKVARIAPQSLTSDRIDKKFSGLIKQIKTAGYKGCSVIETVNELIGQD